MLSLIFLIMWLINHKEKKRQKKKVNVWLKLIITWPIILFEKNPNPENW
jgi:hypothetical protein